MLMTDANFIMPKEIDASRKKMRYSEISSFRTYRIFYMFPGSPIRSIKVDFTCNTLIMSFFNENITLSIDLLNQFIWRFAQKQVNLLRTKCDSALIFATSSDWTCIRFRRYKLKLVSYYAPSSVNFLVSSA